MLSPDRAAEIRNIFNHLTQEQNPEYKFQDKTAAIPRTRKPDNDKERLRQLYRDAAEARKTARELYGTIEGKMAGARARTISAEIDRKKREMGIMQMSDYRRAIEKSKREAEWWRKQMSYWKAREYSYGNRIFSLENRKLFMIGIKADMDIAEYVPNCAIKDIQSTIKPYKN